MIDIKTIWKEWCLSTVLSTNKYLFSPTFLLNLFRIVCHYVQLIWLCILKCFVFACTTIYYFQLRWMRAIWHRIDLVIKVMKINGSVGAEKTISHRFTESLQSRSHFVKTIFGWVIKVVGTIFSAEYKQPFFFFIAFSWLGKL